MYILLRIPVMKEQSKRFPRNKMWNHAEEPLDVAKQYPNGPKQHLYMTHQPTHIGITNTQQ
jgi:hypothetical protein